MTAVYIFFIALILVAHAKAVACNDWACNQGVGPLVEVLLLVAWGGNGAVGRVVGLKRGDLMQHRTWSRMPCHVGCARADGRPAEASPRTGVLCLTAYERRRMGWGRLAQGKLIATYRCCPSSRLFPYAFVQLFWVEGVLSLLLL